MAPLSAAGIDTGGRGHGVTGLAPGILDAPRVVERPSSRSTSKRLHGWAASFWATGPRRIGGGVGKMAAAPGGIPRGSCTSGRSACVLSSGSRPRGNVFLDPLEIGLHRAHRQPDEAPDAVEARPPSQGCAVTFPSRAGSPRASRPATGPHRGPRGHTGHSRRAGGRKPLRRRPSSSRRAAGGRPGSSSRSRAP